MRQLRSSISATLLIIISGCSTPSANTNYGQYPTKYYRESAIEKIKAVLKDPDSGRFEFGIPVKVYVNNGLIQGGGIYFTGYAVPVNVNARNSFDEYTGPQPWTCFVIEDDTRGCTPHDMDSIPLLHKVD